MPANAAENSPVPLGAMIDDLNAIREQRRELASQDKKLGEAYRALEAQIIERLDAEQTPKMNGMTASASISETEIAEMDDSDSFEAYVLENDALYLYQRRLSQPAIRELMKAEGSVPGIRIFTKRSLNLRKSK